MKKMMLVLFSLIMLVACNNTNEYNPNNENEMTDMEETELVGDKEETLPDLTTSEAQKMFLITF